MGSALLVLEDAAILAGWTYAASVDLDESAVLLTPTDSQGCTQCRTATKAGFQIVFGVETNQF